MNSIQSKAPAIRELNAEEIDSVSGGSTTIECSVSCTTGKGCTTTCKLITQIR